MRAGASECEHCGSPQAHHLYYGRDYVSGELFEIVRCQQCGLVRSALDGAEFDRRRYYGPAYYGEKGRRFPEVMERLVHAFRLRRAVFIQDLHPVPGRVLDIGCGRGWMLAELQRRGWECFGTEATRELAASVERRHGFSVRFATDLQGMFPRASFDVISLWHVLEHVHAPAATLREVHRLLKPGGIVIVESPNIGSLQSQVGRGRWFHLDAPRHHYHFTPPSLSAIFEEQGFRVISLTTFSWEYGFYGFYQTLLNFVTRQPNVLFSRLKGSGPTGMRVSPPARVMDDILSVVALPFAVSVGTILELFAALIGKGGVIRLTAVR